MVLKREVVQRRIEELDTTLSRLSRHRDVSLEDYRNETDLQWIVERGLLNATEAAMPGGLTLTSRGVRHDPPPRRRARQESERTAHPGA